MGSMSIKRCFGLALLLLTLAGLSCGNFPLLDVDTNMRIVLVPHDAPVGGIIYRLRASDSDNNFPLTFEVLGALGKSLLSLNFLGCVEAESLCQADVILKKSLDLGRSYEFQLQVKDTTGDYTKVHAAITATAGTANFNPLFGPRIIHLDEDSKEGTMLDKFEVLKNELNSRIVHLEIRDEEDRIGLKQRLVSNNRTEGSLFLKKKLDFERQPWFTFQLLAMNGWTNTSIDTRNILVSDIIVAVHDVQDTPPAFTLLPPSVELNNSIKIGDLMVKVEAVDGDKQNKRLIRYGFLTDSNPFVVFFDLDPMNGEIKLRRNITELLAIAKPNEPIKMTIIAEEIIPESGRFGRSVGTPLDRTMGNITFWFGTASSFGPPKFSSDKFVGKVMENSLPGTLVEFNSPPGVWHQNPSEIISLSFSSGPSSGGIHKANGAVNNLNELLRTFQIIPSQGSGNFSFEIRVVDSTQLDFELNHEIKLMIMASTSSGLIEEVELTIHIRDENDNPPIFSQQEYRVELAEHSPIGTKVLQLKAYDKDTEGNYGKIVYSNLLGSDAFRLDPLTGEITVDKPELLDRELEPEIRLYVEAKDGGHTEFSDTSIIRNIGTATIIIKLHDKNDNRPEFVQKYYQAVLNPELTAFKTPLYVKAYDADEGPNGQVKYQSQDSKFFVDPTTGEVRLRGSFQRNPSDGDGPYLGSFKIRAYDLGNPQQNSETIVQLFSEEMVIREIQFVFPSTPDKIRKNQTNIEKMLSSLTGGIVGIQKITAIGSRGFQQQPNGDSKGKGESGRALTGENNKEEHITEPPPFLTSRSLQIDERSQHDLKSNKKSEGLASGSDKSLVTATVQYPVSATPTRVDLAAFQKAYMSSSDLAGESKPTTAPPDADMIKLYEAENRALFWILIAFLLILLILFSIFLCCIYCPCCWLYGHCYSKGVKSARSDRVDRTIIETKRPVARHTRKIYPEETESSAEGYDRDPEASYRDRRGPRHGRKEAWSGDDGGKGYSWKGNHRRYRGADRPPTPHGKGRIAITGQGQGGHPPQQQDVSLEDWEFDPPRQSDRANEIGPRWQHIQHSQTLPPPQTITVPVPVSIMPLPVQQQLQQQQQQQSQRRVGYIGNAHPGDENYVRRQSPGRAIIQEMELVERTGDGGLQQQGQYGYLSNANEIERSQLIPRHYPGTAVAQSQPLPAESRAAQSHSVLPRKTRFFKTETGEVLQFADFEGDEGGKELLIKRYIDEQQPTQQYPLVDESGRRVGTPAYHQGDPSIGGRYEDSVPGQITTTDRPRAAIFTKRPSKSNKSGKDHELPELTEDDEIDEEVIPDEEPKKKQPTKSKIKPSPEKRQDVEDKDYKSKTKRYKESERKVQKHRRRSHSDESGREDDNYKSKSTSKSKSRSRSKSPSPRSPSRKDEKSRQSKSQSPRPPSPASTSPPPPTEETKSRTSKHTLKKRLSDERDAAKDTSLKTSTEKHHRRTHHRPTKEKEHKEQPSTSKESLQKSEASHAASKSRKKSIDAGADDKSKSTSKSKPTEVSKTIPVVPIPISQTDNQKSRDSEASATDGNADSSPSAPPKSKNTEVQRRKSKELNSQDEINAESKIRDNSNNEFVDINIIPPSSAPMTDSSCSPKENENDRVNSLPETPEENDMSRSNKKKSGGAEGRKETVISIEQTETRVETEVIEGGSGGANVQMEIGGQEEDEDSGI